MGAVLGCLYYQALLLSACYLVSYQSEISAMTLKRAQVLLRLPKPLKVAAEAAATELGLSLTDWLIAAINAQLGEVDSLADSKVEGENVWDAIAALGERLAAVEAELRSHPTQPAPTAPKQHGGLTEEERDAIAAAKRPTDRPTAAAPTAAVEPPAPPLKSLSDRSMRRHWVDAGRPGESVAAWLESFGFTSEGKGNERKWYPPGE